MFDPFTQGKSRYIDRDKLGGVLLQGSALDKTLRWDLARVCLGDLFQGVAFSSIRRRGLYANDANCVAQVRYAPSPDWNATLIGMYVRDKETENDDPNTLNGTGVRTRSTTRSLGLGPVLGPRLHGHEAAPTTTQLQHQRHVCGGGLNGNCRFSPLPSGA